MKGLFVIPALILSSILAAVTGYCAELSGHVVITKKLSKKRVTLPVYQLRGATPASVDGSESGNEFSNVAVFLEGQLPPPDEPTRAELEQRGQRFAPQLLVIPVGSTVSFPNGDPIFHNVFSLSAAKKFDLGYYPAGQTRVVKFDAPGVVQVYCHLHPNMYATIVVAPNRWYTKLRDDGAFSFHDVPPGDYRLVAWHMNAGLFHNAVRVSAAGVTDAIIDIPVRGEEHSR